MDGWARWGWLVLIVASACPSAGAAEGLWDKVAGYEVGRDRYALTEVAEQVGRRSSDPDARRQLESRLLAVWQREDATVQARQFVGRQLARIGSAAAVAPLAGALDDPNLHHSARLALERIAAPEATTALVGALDRLDGELRLGVIASLGARRDASAVAPLAGLIGAEPAVARSAVHALGRIASPSSAEALLNARKDPPAGLADDIDHALLATADRLAGRDPNPVREIHEALKDSTVPGARLARWRWRLATEPGAALDELLRVVSSADPNHARTARALLVEVPCQAFPMLLIERLTTEAPEAKVLLLAALAERGDRQAAPAVRVLLDHEAPSVREAAIRAVGAVGQAQDVPRLMAIALSDSSSRSQADRALRRLRGDGVDEAIAAGLASAPAGAQVWRIEVLTDRRARSVAGRILPLIHSDQAMVRARAIGALARLGSVDELAGLLTTLRSADPITRRALEKAARGILRRMVDPASGRKVVLAELDGAAGETRCALLRIGATVGGSEMLRLVVADARSQESAVARTALRLLSHWSSPEAIEPLMALAENPPRKRDAILALRGAVRIAGRVSLPANQKVAVLARALALADRPQEKRRALAAMGQVGHMASVEALMERLSDESLRGEAARAILSAVEKMGDQRPSESLDALRQAREHLDQDGQNRADDLLNPPE